MNYLFICTVRTGSETQTIVTPIATLEEMDGHANAMLETYGEQLSIVLAAKIEETYDYKRVEHFTR